jgi:alpha-galactosidase
MLRRRPSVLLLLTTIVIVCTTAHPFAQKIPIAASSGDAYIGYNASDRTWFIGNANVSLEIGFDGGGRLALRRLRNQATGADLQIGVSPEPDITVGGQSFPLNFSNATSAFVRAAMEGTDTGVQLALTFEHRSTHAVIKRYFAVYPGSPTFEAWTRLEAPPRSPAIQVSNLMAWQLGMPAGRARWINGLRGQGADDAFAVNERELAEGEQITLGSDRRSSEQHIPLVFVNVGSSEFYGGVLWSGAWRMSLGRSDGRISVTTSFPDVSTALTPERPVEFPHAFFGFSNNSVMAETSALRQFIVQGVRRGRPLYPLVTYNTWFPYGAYIDEWEVQDEMSRAGWLGVELFVLDAGWYQGAGVYGKGDYTSGLGSWTPDPDRFPSQLVGLSDQAHALGMRFGLWVEPERIALSLVGQPESVEQEWLATHDGGYETEGESAQICLATAGWQWVYDRIVQLIETVHPDYLKWDNNAWTNCNREGHDHGPDDGNFAHVQALYRLLDQIRQRYPNLMIENVSGGGNRLDYGMLAYTDAAWMDDRTAPSTHVRHNLEGLSQAFPPAYLLSFLINTSDEPISSSMDLPEMIRSRMLGILGLTYGVGDVTGMAVDVLATEVNLYKLLRGTIADASAFLLSDQAPVGADGWDVLQQVSADQRTAIIFAFKNDSSEGSLVVRPRNLLPDAMYEVTSMDAGGMGSAPGNELMAAGVELVHVADVTHSRAHLIVFSVQPPSDDQPQPPLQEALPGAGAGPTRPERR